MLLFFKKLWAFTKKYWQLLLLVLAVPFGVLLFRRRENSFIEDYKKLQSSHDEELKKIEEAHAIERKKHEENVKLLEKTLETIQQKYDEQKKALDEKKKLEIKEIVSQYGNDPVELAKKLSEVTGFTIVMPQ